jgi:hypothetical protein
VLGARTTVRSRWLNATRRKVPLAVSNNFRPSFDTTRSRNNGNFQTTREALGDIRKPNSIFITCIWHTRSSHQPPPSSCHTRPAGTATSRKNHSPTHITSASYTTAARLSYLYQEAQSHPHILGTPSISDFCGEALWLRMAGGRSGREGAGGSG